MLIMTGRDMGPMLKAEQAARAEFKPAKNTAKKQEPQGKAINAILPLMVLIISVIGGLLLTGWPEAGQEVSLTNIFGNADPFKAMLWASLLSATSALLISKFNSDMDLTQIMHALEELSLIHI